MKKGVTTDKVVTGAKLNRELGMYFKFFMLYGFPQETHKDHRISEEIVRKTRPDSVCVGLIQPIPGTEFYEEVKPYLKQDVAEIEFHYWHAVESFEHPLFSHAELHEERQKLIQVHHDATKGFLPRLHRKLERVVAMFKHPELIGDWFEVRRRQRRHRARVAKTDWAYIYKKGTKNVVSQQVPTIGVS
jgi:tRNA A37 methylthiotransferase MiaB